MNGYALKIHIFDNVQVLPFPYPTSNYCLAGFNLVNGDLRPCWGLTKWKKNAYGLLEQYHHLSRPSQMGLQNTLIVASLQRDKTPPMNILEMTLDNLMVRFQ